MSKNAFINALLDPKAYDHPVEKCTLLETHLSWVILTGDYAYKIKKPVNFGFVNYTTLEKRYHYCREELRLNKALAPQIYKEVVSINGSPDAPQINGKGPAIEYALKMVEFPQAGLMNILSDERKITPEIIDQLADDIACFHQRSARASRKLYYGRVDKVHEPVQENFDDIRAMLSDKNELDELDKVEAWANQVFQDNQIVFKKRKAKGFIKECHGDIHLGNIVQIEDQAVIFDCIEFNEDFRWIDVLADIAFLAMDLDNHDYSIYADRLVNRYLQRTGDYKGLPILRYYQSYRAMVRAKVTLLRLQQTDISEGEREHLKSRYQRCLNLALNYTKPKPKWIMITHGVSCSGKSTISRWIAEHKGAIQIRSDVERKRLHGLAIEAKSDSTLLGNIYTDHSTEKTYQYLTALAQHIIRSGYPVIVDATFLKERHREMLKLLADKLQIPFIILHTYAPAALLNQWILEREAKFNDPSEANQAVLKMQTQGEEPLTSTEMKNALTVDSEKYHMPCNIDWILPVLDEKLEAQQKEKLPTEV